MSKIARLTPYISQKIWGHESFEVSTHKAGESLIGHLPLSGFIQLNYLVKFIHTFDDLSIQVHPSDEYAKIHNHDKGKTECWLILDAKEDASIFLGFKNGVTKKEFRTAIDNGLNVEHFLESYKVKPGDFYTVPAGTIHAIGGGISLLEIQQSSGVTYRVWDYKRKDDKGMERELHVEDAFQVLNFNQDFNEKVKQNIQKRLFLKNENIKLFKHDDFNVELVFIPKNKDIPVRLQKGEALINLNKELILDGETLASNSSLIAMEEYQGNLMAMEQSFIVIIS